jgi:hypothetical protein
LHDAEADLQQVIAELDERTRSEFQRTFEAVAEEFHVIFRRLFGGGSARLVLTDPEDLTITGIDIEARLPGRREQGLALLSGGERSLTAMALVFAPDLVTTEALYVDVETGDGPAHAATCADFWRLTGRPPNMRVALDVDAERFMRLFVARMIALADGLFRASAPPR